MFVKVSFNTWQHKVYLYWLKYVLSICGYQIVKCELPSQQWTNVLCSSLFWMQVKIQQQQSWWFSPLFFTVRLGLRFRWHSCHLFFLVLIFCRKGTRLKAFFFVSLCNISPTEVCLFCKMFCLIFLFKEKLSMSRCFNLGLSTPYMFYHIYTQSLSLDK